MGRARQHAIFRRHPALAGIAQEGRNLLVDRRGAQNMRVAEFGQARAFGIFGGMGFETDLTQVVMGAAGRTDDMGQGDFSCSLKMPEGSPSRLFLSTKLTRGTALTRF